MIRFTDTRPERHCRGFTEPRRASASIGRHPSSFSRPVHLSASFFRRQRIYRRVRRAHPNPRARVGGLPSARRRSVPGSVRGSTARQSSGDPGASTRTSPDEIWVWFPFCSAARQPLCERPRATLHRLNRSPQSSSSSGSSYRRGAVEGDDRGGASRSIRGESGRPTGRPPTGRRSAEGRRVSRSLGMHRRRDLSPSHHRASSP